MTRSEQETIVRSSEDAADLMTVYTHRRRLARALQAQGASLKRDARVRGEVVSWTLECPR